MARKAKVEAEVVETTNEVVTSQEEIETTNEAVVEDSTETKVEEENDYKVQENELDQTSETKEEVYSESEASEAVKVEDVVEKNNRNGRIVLFDKKEAKRFKLTPNGMVKATLYKQLIFTFSFDGKESIDLYNPIKASFVSELKSLIRSLNVQDIEYRDMDYNQNAINDYGRYHMFCVLIPYTSRTGVIVSTLINFVNEENGKVDTTIPPEYKVIKHVTIRNSAVIDVDTSAENNSTTFLKSLIVASTIDMKNGVADLRSGLFIDSETGWEDKDAKDMNKYILANTKINIYSTSKDPAKQRPTDYTYRVGMRSRVNFVVNEVYNRNEDGTFDVEQTVITLQLFIKEMFGKSIPIGVNIRTNKDVVKVNKFSETLITNDRDGMTMDIVSKLTGISEESACFRALHQDYAQIDENIFSVFAPADEK